MSFLTLEDINTTIYTNQTFGWYELDTEKISPTEDFTNVKYDFFEVSRETVTGQYPYKFTIKINSTGWTNVIWPSGVSSTYDSATSTLTLYMGSEVLHLHVYLGPIQEQSLTFSPYYLKTKSLTLTYEELNTAQEFDVYAWGTGLVGTASATLDRGYNRVVYDGDFAGQVLVNLIKSDFQFECNQVLTNGKVNTVLLGVDSDYKPSGAMVGDYAPYITVVYGEEILPVQWNPTANDYTFDIDLTNRERENDIVLNVRVDVNEVLNSTETEIRLHTRFETINDISKVNTLFTNGGIGRLGADITLTGDLTVQEDIYLIGNDYTIDLDGHKIIVPTDKTFKASNVNFRNGENTIQQNTGSKVGLTDCTFGYCTGLGSVIDCQVDLDSLENPTDFTTTLTRCIIGECETAILHGGDLTITDCKVDGIISDPSYPYFLYQTDGNATILQSEFTLISNTQISTDIEFNSCIFICGETAQINGYSHQELQNNNITQFLETQRNSSVINVTYLYTPISDYITLYSEKGYCHSVSDVDYVFKTNVTPTRID